MSTYAFEVMSQGQAAGFTASDQLLVATALPSLSVVSVAYAGDNVTLTVAGKSLTFGPAFSSRVNSLRPADAPGIVIGTTGNDVIKGGNATGTLSPLTFAGDVIFGGPGDDTLEGGGGSDTLSGGPGADLFISDGGDVITDFESIDRIGLPAFAVVSIGAADYVEGMFATENAAALFAQGELAAGRANIVATQVGSTVTVRADPFNINALSVVITLRNTSLAAIDSSNFVKMALLTAPRPPSPVSADAPPPLIATAATPAPVGPAAPPASANFRGQDGAVTGNMDDLHFGGFKGVTPAEATGLVYRLNSPAAGLVFGGSGFVYDAHGVLTEGQVGFFRFSNTTGPQTSFALNVPTPGIRTTSFGFWVDNDNNQAAFSTILINDDTLSGSAGADLIRAYGGADFIVGRGGGDTLWGGSGDDIIYAYNTPGAVQGAVGSTYLRGEEGADWIAGGDGFDDANGNQGDDTISTGAGDDYCVGGKDNDLLFGDAGGDFVYGNIGADTCEGGDGNDIVRGGQDNDIVRGGNGDDFVSGDKGDDTMSGGAGADIFHTFGDANLDRVLDFNFAEGDRVQVDPGTSYTLAQEGMDTVISMAGGGRMVLVGVPLISLSPGWIFGA
ncbi:calcium-binding protein [Phenylobacterium sp.]|uniref:calcium-binding protein n=1 Tax=Phenylobacterium sp. TaxID=1871053 RepID=UPI0025E75167|nr:calcium-binding protein [Phenylobacterium sp.]